MNAYKVEKDEVPARLHLSDGATLEGTLYLSPCSPNHSGPQTVDELMEEPGRALRFRDADGRFVLAGKASVAAVSTPIAAGRPPGFWTLAPVTVRISGHLAVEGSLLLEEGGGARLSDALDAPKAWIPLETAESLIWLAKEHIVTLQERGE